jgi:hypothetical protein
MIVHCRKAQSGLLMGKRIVLLSALLLRELLEQIGE